LNDKPVAPDQFLAPGVRRYPFLVIDIDVETYEILAVTPVSGDNAWGCLPMPNF